MNIPRPGSGPYPPPGGFPSAQASIPPRPAPAPAPIPLSGFPPASVSSQESSPVNPSVARRWWRNWSFWLIVLTGLYSLFEVLYTLFAVDWRAVPLSIFPALLAVPLLLFLDRHEPEPRWARAQGLLYGLTIAIFVAGVLNTVFLVMTSLVLGAAAASLLTAVVCAPLVEEAIKGLGVARFRAMGVIDGPLDGVIFAGWIGLGFAMLENVGYLARSGSEGELVLTFVLRCVFSPLAHLLFTSFIGWGVGESVRSNRRWAPFAGYGAAVALHATWNLSTAFPTVVFILVYLLEAGILFALGYNLVRLRSRDNQRARQAVRHLVASGSVSHEEAEAATRPALRASMVASTPSPQRLARLERLVMIHRAAVAIDDAHAARMAPFAVRRANALLLEVSRTAPAAPFATPGFPHRFGPSPAVRFWPTPSPAYLAVPAVPSWQEHIPPSGQPPRGLPHPTPGPHQGPFGPPPAPRT